MSFNTKELTLACLRSVAEHTRIPHEVIVVDNGSRDGSAEAIVAEFGDRIKVLTSKENLGFAAGNNRAAEEAAGEFVLLLNPDTELRGPAIDAVLEEADREQDAGIWGGRTTFGDGSLNPSSCWSRPTLWTTFCYATGLTRSPILKALFDPETLPNFDRGHAREVDVISGCFLLMRAALWRELQGFDERFHMYAEDIDLCLRARVAGARPRITPAATLVHHGGASEHSPADKTVRLFRAKVQLFQKHWSPISANWGRALLVLGAGSRSLGLGLLARLNLVAPESRAKWAEVYRRRSEWAI